MIETMSPTTSLAILRCREVIKRTGMSKATLYRRIADGEFPRSVSLGGSMVGWLESEINNWIASRVSSHA
jgi:prophage regulatory protein